MRNILNYQSSEYDCGPTSLVNALRYLFDREQLPPELLRAITLYTLDAFNDRGEIGKFGTSRMAMQFLSNWFGEYGRTHAFPLSSAFLTESDVTVSQNSELVSALQLGGAAVVRCYLGGDPHYVLLTGIREDEISLFDPYWCDGDALLRDERTLQGTVRVLDDPFRANRAVRAAALNAPGLTNYSLGAFCVREAMLLFNEDAKKQNESSLDFVI